MLLNDARRDARFADGTVVLLRDQDRSLWDAGRDRARDVPRSSARSPSAAAAPTSCRRRSPSLHLDEPQDWPQLAALYGELARLTGSPVVELNQAAALAEAGDVEAALAIVERPRPRRATTTSTRRAPSCCAGSNASTTPVRRTAARWSSSTPTRSGASSNGGSQSSREDVARPLTSGERRTDPRAVEQRRHA